LRGNPEAECQTDARFNERCRPRPKWAVEPPTIACRGGGKVRACSYAASRPASPKTKPTRIWNLALEAPPPISTSQDRGLPHKRRWRPRWGKREGALQAGMLNPHQPAPPQ
jgi:hypothetical protein